MEFDLNNARYIRNDQIMRDLQSGDTVVIVDSSKCFPTIEEIVVRGLGQDHDRDTGLYDFHIWPKDETFSIKLNENTNVFLVHRPKPKPKNGDKFRWLGVPDNHTLVYVNGILYAVPKMGSTGMGSVYTSAYDYERFSDKVERKD